MKFSVLIQHHDHLLSAVSHLWFDVRFKIRSKTAECELCGVPQLVTEMTITLYAKDVKIDVTSCKTTKEGHINMFEEKNEKHVSSNVLCSHVQKARMSTLFVPLALVNED